MFRIGYCNPPLYWDVYSPLSLSNDFVSHQFFLFSSLLPPDSVFIFISYFFCFLFHCDEMMMMTMIMKKLGIRRNKEVYVFIVVNRHFVIFMFIFCFIVNVILLQFFPFIGIFVGTWQQINIRYVHNNYFSSHKFNLCLHFLLRHANANIKLYTHRFAEIVTSIYTVFCYLTRKTMRNFEANLISIVWCRYFLLWNWINNLSSSTEKSK